MQLEAIKNIIIKILGCVIYRISNIKINNPIVILIINSLVASISLLVSINLRIGIDFINLPGIVLFNNVLVFGLVSASIFIWLQINNQSLHYKDINKLLLSILISNIIYIPLMYFMNWNSNLPFSIIIINLFVMSFLLLGIRYVYYTVFKPKSYTLLIGNRNSISAFINSYKDVINNPLNNIGSLCDPISFGIINTNADTQIITKNNIPVIGNINDLSYIISSININQVIITTNDISNDNKELLRVLSDKYKFLILQTGINIDNNDSKE